MTAVAMDLSHLIGIHGYWLLLVGCLLEGETLLVLAGFAAHRGYLNLVLVIAVASAAGFAGDQAYFWLGRRHGGAMLARFPSIQRQTQRVQRLIERYPRLSIVGVRFAYGLRIAGPVLMGTTHLPGLRFAAFNALGAMLWATAVASLGWVFGEAAKLVLGELRHVEGWLMLGGLGIGLLAWTVRKVRASRRA
jgi:membrane protein DedA with SNARE-associated domain